jgi:hypothetical protein
MPLEVGRRAPRREITVPGPGVGAAVTYRAVPDLVAITQLVVAGRLIERLSGLAWTGPFRLEATADGPLPVRTGRSGVFAVAADPQLAFPLLATHPYTLTLRFTVPGCRPIERVLPLPAGTALPLPELGLELDRWPVVLAGRVVEAAGAGAPIPDARLRFTSLRALLLRTPLQLDHPAATVVRAVNLAPTGALQNLETEARRGAVRLALSNRLGLGVGDVLRLGEERRWELAIVAELPPLPANPALPGEVVLSAPLVRSFAAGTAVEPMNVAELPAAAALDAPVWAGGGVLTVDAPLGANAVRLRGAADPLREFHAVGAVCDADGFFEVDGVDRPGAAVLRATAAGFQPGEAAFVPDFRAGTQRLDFALAP